MILTNVIYFNGKWQWAFSKQSTAPSIFHISSKQSVMTDFMNLTRTFPYYEDDDVQALRMPYQGERLSMTILLPRAVEGWGIISRILNHERLQNMEEHFKPAKVFLSLPKFKLEEKMNLSNKLSAMGMDKAFNRDADFSGMNGEKNLFIDEMIHKAFIEVGESGTEAAAATGAIMSLKSALRDEPVRFNVNHPFLYFIRDHQTGCIIFLGRLVKPS
jgi:serpin B